MAERKDWRKRICYCGKRVNSRFQYDVAYCGSVECWDKSMAALGYVPSPKLLADREERAKLEVKP